MRVSKYIVHWDHTRWNEWASAVPALLGQRIDCMKRLVTRNGDEAGMMVVAALMMGIPERKGVGADRHCDATRAERRRGWHGLVGDEVA